MRINITQSAKSASTNKKAKNGAAKIESSKRGSMYFILLEGKGFFWLGKLKLNLCGEKAAILAALDDKGCDFFSCFLADAHALETLHFEALNAVFRFIVHGAERSKDRIQNVWRCAVILRVRGAGRIENGKDLFVREHLFRFHDLLCHKTREAQSLFLFLFYGARVMEIIMPRLEKRFFIFRLTGEVCLGNVGVMLRDYTYPRHAWPR